VTRSKLTQTTNSEPPARRHSHRRLQVPHVTARARRRPQYRTCTSSEPRVDLVFELPRRLQVGGSERASCGDGRPVAGAHIAPSWWLAATHSFAAERAFYGE
jgi:hypothetical protein